jgi:hypothetical protein
MNFSCREVSRILSVAQNMTLIGRRVFSRWVPEKRPLLYKKRPSPYIIDMRYGTGMHVIMNVIDRLGVLRSGGFEDYK